MERKRLLKVLIGLLFLSVFANLTSAVIVDADYVTVFPGEEGRVSINIENSENFDIEDVVISLDLADLPFTSVGSSSRDIDNLDENDDDSVTFNLLPSTDIVPGDYSIPYEIDYVNANNSSQNITKTGSFGIRVSAETDLDFSAETRDIAVIGKEGQISIDIINRGLGDIKSVSVEILPNGFELLSGSKVFVGTISPDDSDSATFDVIYKATNPTFSARVTYKDFDNVDHTETVSLPLRVYTEDQAVNLGLIEKSKNGFYLGVLVIFLLIWFIWRRVRKNRQKKMREEKMAGR